LVCAVLKGLISPLLGLLSAILLGLDALEARIAIVYLATPTAIASFVLAGQFGSNEKLAATSIIVSTFVSIVSLPLGLWVTGDDVWQWLCQVI
jgi:predicted permease